MRSSHIVKICGNRFTDDSMMVASHRPDYMGWIFAPSSKRRVTVPVAERLIHRISGGHPSIRHAAVFAGNSVTEIVEILHRVPYFDTLQVVDGFGFIEQLRNRLAMLGLEPDIVPVVRVKESISNVNLTRFGKTPFVLLDQYVAGAFGGTGQQLDLSLIAAVTRPYLIAGGIRPDNVESIVRGSRPIGVDVSSGVEFPNDPGRKDPAKVAALIETVRSLAPLNEPKTIAS